MKPLFHVLPILLIGLVFNNRAIATCAPTQILRDDVLIVVNDNSISSPQVGDYYCEQRGIDPANIAHVRIPVTNDIKLDQFTSLRDQLIKHMQENTLPLGMIAIACDTSENYTLYYCPESIDQLRQYSRIRYLVMTKGLPIRFKFTGSTLAGNLEASVDNYLRFWLTNYFPQDAAFKTNHRAIAFGDGRGMRTINPLSDYELVVGRIDGVNTESAKRLIDRAINAEKNGIYGKLYGNKFGGKIVDSSVSKGANWRSWLPNGSTETVYPSWHYLHGLFGEFQGSTNLAVRHTTNAECISYDFYGRVPNECVTAVNLGGIPDSFNIFDSSPGAPKGRIPSPDNALIHQGYLDTFSSLKEFDDLLNWRESLSCNTLCDKNDAACIAASTDAYKEIDTRCVRVADGYMGYVFGSYPVGMMASWPTGWFQSRNKHPNLFHQTGGGTYYYWQPEVRSDDGFDDNFSLWYRNADSTPSSVCYIDAVDYQVPPTNYCNQEKKISLSQIIEIPERAINLTNPQKITIRFKYRGVDLNKNISLKARLLVRESTYQDEAITIGLTNQLVYNQQAIKTIIAPNDPADGTGWGDGVVSFTLDPTLHKHPQYLYNGLKIRIETDHNFEGEFAVDNFSVEEDGITLPLVNPSFDDGHRQLSGGDSAATFLSRLNGTAFWANITHHGDEGASFDTHPYETLIYFMRGLPLGDAVWFAETRNGGIFYGDPIYTPVAIHLHYLPGADEYAPKDYFNTVADSPLMLTGDTLNGSGTNVTTTYSIDFCSGNDFLTCDQSNSWLPIAGLQDLPGGQRDMSLGEWDLSSLTEGDYVLRLAVTSANSTKGLSQIFYDYYPVTFYSPSPYTDADADGLNYEKEIEVGTNPWNNDTDADGLPDAWEVNFGLNPLTVSTNTDSDNDGYTDLIEFLRATDPADSQSTPLVSIHDVDPVNGVDDGQSPFKTLAAAIKSAQAGDTISLFPGKHVANYTFFTAPIHLQGSANQNTVLQAVAVFNTSKGTVFVSNLTFNSANLTINGNTSSHKWLFERNDFNTNITLSSGSTVEFVNNIFTNASSDAINVLDGSSAVLRNNTLTNNNVGVRASTYSNVQIINSIITGNTSADLVDVPPSAVSYSLTGDQLLAGTNGNISGAPLFIDALNNDFHLQQDSPTVDAGDPQSDYSREPASTIGRINIGSYGNTAEAVSIASNTVDNGSAQSSSSGQINRLFLLWLSVLGLWRIRFIRQYKK